MSPRLASLMAVAGVACTGTLEHEPGAYFGGVSVSDAGAGGKVAPADGPPRTLPPDPVQQPPQPAPDAAPRWEDAAPSWDAPAPADAMAQPVMPPPDAAPISVCAPGADAPALLAARCGGCHNPMNAAKGLDLRTAGVGMRVVGVASTCQMRPLLANGPGAPAGHLLDKLDGPVPGCGNQMPFGGPSLSAQEKACVREWAAQAIAKFGTGR
jgi:hypothetical protein